MRKLIQFTFLGLCVLMSGSLLAQEQKIAFVDSDKLIAEHPDKITMDAELAELKKSLTDKLEAEQTEFNEWAQGIVVQIQEGELSPKEQKLKEEEIQTRRQELQKQAFVADQELAKKEQELSQPIIDKFNAAIKKVATEKGYTYILDSKMFLHIEGGIDATEEVKAAM